MANHKEEEKMRARELYFRSSVTQSYIAREIGVAERTISVWATEGNWKALKKSQFYSPQVEAHRLYEELRVISNNISKRPLEQRFATKEELEARTRLIGLINSLEKIHGSWRNISGDLGLPEEPVVPTQTDKTHENSIIT